MNGDGIAPRPVMSAGHGHLSARELALIVLFWTSLAALSVLNRFVDPRGDGLRVIVRAGPVMLPFVEAWLWAALTPLIFWLSSRSSVAMSRALRIVILIGAGIVIALFVTFVLDFARVEIFSVRRRAFAFEPFRGMGRFRVLNQLMVYAAVLTAGFAREYFLRDQEQKRHAARLEAQLAQARLGALRMQLNPHFLFNTLNAISALVERDPAGVRRMIARLGELLRHTLESRGGEVPLRDELAFLQRYLDIMQIRFLGRLHVGTTIDETALDARVPDLILQPIVENALEHGVSRTGDARIEIAARRDGKQLVLAVTDHGPGFNETADGASGVGLTNTRARLATMYGDDASVAVTRASGGGATVELRLPWRDHD